MISLRPLLLRAFLLIFGLCCLGQVHAANISPGMRGVGVSIDGEIKTGDFLKYMMFVVENADKRSVSADIVFLNSSGGNVQEALKFAKQFTNRFTTTIVSDGKSCFSACTLMWSGGSDRILQGSGRLGFHRLSFVERDVSVARAKATLGPGTAEVVTFLKDVGIPNLLIEKMNETAPTDLFLVDNRWLTANGLERTVAYQPAFLDVAEKQCGTEPFNAMLMNRESFTPDVNDKYKRWLDCADGVKDANRRLQTKAVLEKEKDFSDKTTLRQMAELYGKMEWTVLFSTVEVVVLVNKKSQKWSGASAQVPSITQISAISSSYLDYKVVDCANGTISFAENMPSVFCDDRLCKVPVSYSINGKSSAKTPDPGSISARFIEATCKAR